MTVTDQIKIFNKIIKQNEAQYDLWIYEYLTGEDLSLNPSTVEQTKFEYSPWGKIFNNGLDKEEDKKEGLFKRLENIKDKNEKLLNAFSKAPKNKVKNQNKQNKNLFYNSQHSFVKLKILMNLKNCHSILCIKNLNIFV